MPHCDAHLLLKSKESMNPEPKNSALENLIHDVNSICANLKGGAGLLRHSSPSETLKLLGLMSAQAQQLARSIGDFERSRSIRQ